MTQTARRAIDPEDSPGSGRTSQTLTVHRHELRYLLGSGQAQYTALAEHLPATNNYHVQTLYLDTPEGTWSKAMSQDKIRLRQYNGTGPWWFEVKTNISGVVDKERRQVTPAQVDKLGLVPVMMITYDRTEFQDGLDRPNDDQSLRVTIDNMVTMILVATELPPSQVMQSGGTPIAILDNLLLEIKSPSMRPPGWLPVPSIWPGSKSRWGLSLLHGVGNMWASSHKPLTPA